MAIGTIKIDIDQLSSAVKTLNLIKLSLDAEAGYIMNLNTQVDQSIQGTASSIGIFDGQFQAWANDLQKVAGEMDGAYAILSKALADARKLVGDL